MAKQLYVNLDVRANTQQAKNEFQSLQKSLSDIIVQTNKISNTSIDSTSLRQASSAAQELQRHLSNAVNIDTGKLDLNKLNTSLKQSKTNIGELSGKLLSVGSSGEQAFVKLAQSVASAERPIVSLGSRVNGLLTTLKNTARWQISSSILHGFMGAIQSAYGYAQDLNRSLNNIRIVTGQNADQMNEFAVSANKAAKALNTSTLNYTDASLIYYQQGIKDQKEIEDRTATTIKLANVSRQSAEEVSSQMTAIWNNFEDGSHSLEYYADVITKLGATTASSSSEISEGISKFASVADTVGLSYDKAAASVATVVAETRQSADTVGTAFKTMFARVEGLKLGETLEDGVDLNKYSTALKTVGVNILDSNKELKGMDTILDELGKKWNSISETQQIALAQTVAGVRQYTQFMSLMNNYDKVLQNEKMAEGSSGTLQEQADTYAESWEAAQKRVKATAQGLYDDLLDDKFFIGLNNVFADLLTGLSNFIKGIGGLKGVLMGVGSLVLNYISDKIQPALSNLKNTAITMFQSPAKQAQVYKDLMDKIISQAKNISKDSMTDSLKTKLQYTDQLSTAKNRLMSVDKQLTEAEKQQAQQQLNIIDMYYQETQAIANKLTKEKEEIEVAVSSLSTNQAVIAIEESRKDELAGLIELQNQAREGYEKASGFAEIIEAAEAYRKAAAEVEKFKTETDLLASTEEDLVIELRNGYDIIMQQSKGLAEGDGIVINLGQHLGTTAEGFKVLADKARQAMNGTSSITKGELIKEFRNLQVILDQLGLSKIPQVEDKLSKLLSKGKRTNLKDLESGFKELFNILTNLKIPVSKDAEQIEWLRKLLIETFKDGKNIEYLNGLYNKAGKSAENLANSQNHLNTALASFNPQHMMSGVEVFSKISAAGMQAAMVINSVKSIISAWQDEDMDPLEKFTTTLMGISMIVPGVISSIQGISTVMTALTAAHSLLNIQTQLGIGLNGEKIAVDSAETAETISKTAANTGLLSSEQALFAQEMMIQAIKIKGSALNAKEVATIIAKAGATNINTAALGGEAIATEAATAAQWSLNAAMDANPIGLIIVAIMALIAALALLVVGIAAVVNAKSEEEKALEKANKELEKAQEEAKAAKEAYENLYSKVSDYKTAYEALQKCTKGTKEWKEAFEEVSNKANELIEAYPDLLKYENLFDANGLINSKALDKALKEYEDRVSATKITTIQKQANVTSAQYEVNKSNLSDKIKINDVNEQSANNIAKAITSSLNYHPVEAGKALVSSIESAQLDEKISNGVTSALLANKDKINNYFDSESVSEVIKNYLEKNAEEYSLDNSRIDELTNEFTKKTISLGNDFADLSAETKKTITAMTNASKMIAQEFFGEELNMSNPEKILSYNEALQNYQIETEEKIINAMNNATVEATEKMVQSRGAAGMTTGGIISEDSYLNEIGQTYINNNTDEEKKNWKFKNVRNDYWNGTLEYVYVDEKGAEQEISADLVKDFMVQYEAQRDRDKIIAEGETNSKNQQSDSEKAISQYLVNSNLNGATIKQATVLSKISDPLEAYFGEDYTDDDIKEKLAVAWGKDVSEISDDEFETWKSGIASNLKEVQDMIAETPNFIKKAMGDDLINSLSVEAFPKVTEMFSQAYVQNGQAGVDMLKSIVDSAGDESSQVMAALSDMDFGTMNIDDANTALKNLGIQFQLSEIQFYSLKNTLQDISTVTAETAKETYKTVSSILSKLKAEGDIIEDEDYQKLLALNPAIESFFITLADGTHMLTGEVKDFKTAMQSASLNQLQQVQENSQKTALAYGKLSSSGSVSGSLNNINDFENSSQAEILNAQIQVMRDQGEVDRANNYEVQLKDALDTGNLEKLNQILENGNQSWIDYGVSTEEATKKIEEAEKEAGELTEAIKEQQYQNEISNAGLEYEATENYADVLMELYEAEGLSKDAARELAIANQRVDRGLTSLNDNLDDWKTSLEKTNKASAEYAETISGLRESFSDLLNIADGSELSLSWIEKWAKSADMTKILDGDTEALERFRKSAFTEMTTNVFSDMKDSVEALIEDLDQVKDAAYLSDLQNLSNVLNDGTFSAENLRNAIQDLGNQEIGSGATLSDEYVESLNSMLAAGLMTEQQLNDIFATIGYKPKVRTASVDQWVEIPIYKTTEEITEDTSSGLMSNLFGGTRKSTRTVVSKTVQTGTERMLQKVPVTQIESADTAGGNIEIVNAGSNNITPSYSSTTTGSGSNSDSSSNSSSTPTTKVASHTHEINRYTAEENAIDGLSKQYEKLNNIKDKSFGKGKIQAIENEIKALKELKQASTNYMDAIVGDGNGKRIAEAIYRGENIGDLLRNGAISGNLGSDYRALSYGISASGKQVEYTAKDEAGNEWLASRDYNINDFNAMFGTNIHFDLDAFGNIQNADSIRNQLQQLKNNESDAYSSIADPTASSTTRYNERMAYIDEILDRMDTFGDSINTLSEQSEEYLDYITQLQEKNAELITSKMELGVELGDKSLRRIDRALKVLGNDIYRSTEAMKKAFELNDQKIESSQEKAQSYQEMMNEAERRFALYQKNPLNEDAITPAEYAEMLSTAEEGFESIADEMREYMNYFYDMYSGMQDYWEEKISRITKQMEDSIKVLEYYQKVLELTGRSGDYELIGKILEGQAETAKTIFETSQARAELAKKEWERQKDDLEKAKLDPTLSKDLLDTLENMTELAYEKYVEAVETAREDSLNYLEITQTAFENKIKQMRVESEKFLTNGSDFDSLNKSMERQKSLSEDYLTKTNQLYETNKMLRQLNQDIDKTDSVIAKNKLKAFADEISAMQDQEKLSNTSLEIAKAKYEILQAQIALEDAQNAKSTVQLRRDSEGNYGYVYTADEEAVNNAQQNLEDKVNALYNLGKKASEDFAERMIQLEQEEWAEIEEIANNTILTTDEKNIKIAELQEYYNAKRQALSEQYEEANLALQQGAVAQRLLITDKFNTENLDIEKVAAEARAEAWTESFATTIKDQNTYEAHFKQLASQLKSEMQKLDDKRKQHEQATKTGNKEIKESIDDITDAVDDLSYEILKRDGLLDSYSDALNASNALKDSFKRQYETARELANQYSNAADRASNLYTKTVDLINAQVALNHANNGATYVEWGPGGVTADYNGNTVSNGGNGNNSSNKISVDNKSQFKKVDPSKVILWQDEYYHFKNGDISKINNRGAKYGWEWDELGYKYKTGGYTGSWNGPDVEENGKLAFLHQKELVLNADDTENMLNAVKLIRQISESIDLQAAVQSSYSVGAIQFPGNNQVLQQEVTIHAEFPNATDHNEIEEAFNSLVNRASQYANRS